MVFSLRCRSCTLVLCRLLISTTVILVAVSCVNLTEQIWSCIKYFPEIAFVTFITAVAVVVLFSLFPVLFWRSLSSCHVKLYFLPVFHHTFHEFHEFICSSCVAMSCSALFSPAHLTGVCHICSALVLLLPTSLLSPCEPILVFLSFVSLPTSAVSCSCD